MNKNEVDMLHGSLVDKILIVALPLAAISILQQLFNAADVAVVGQFASDNSLAAVGANTPIINMFLTLFTGLATGGNVALSMNIGKGEENGIKRCTQTIYTLSIICGILVVVVGQIIAKPLLLLVNTPDTVLSKALLYFRIYLFAMLFAVIYNFLSAILRSKGDTKRPLYCLIISGVVNVILNLILVIIFKLDVAGVAIATLIANILCCFICLYILMNEKDAMKIDLYNFMMDKDSLKYILKIGLPAGIQGMLFSISNIIIQSGINSFGSACIAGNTAAMNFEFMAYFFVQAFGQTATTFVSQNYAAGKFERVRLIFRDCLLLGMIITAVVSSTFYFGEHIWLSLFTSSTSVLFYAFIRMQFVVWLEPIGSFIDVSSGCLRGMGISLQPTIITILGTCVFRIIWVSTVFVKYHTFNILIYVYPISWAMLSVGILIMYAYYYRKLVKSKMN